MNGLRRWQGASAVVAGRRSRVGGFGKRLVSAALVLAALPAGTSAAPPPAREYAGATICAPCHREIFDQWRGTGHARIMTRPLAAEARDIPLPLGLTEADVSRVIGGFRWKALFLDREGFLLTSDGGGPGRTQFNLAGRGWADFRPGETVPYDCGPCHTTGYAAEGHQDGLPGIVGTWSLDGVQCEACHGPGSLHARTRQAKDIAGGGERCAACHGLDSPQGIPLDGAFLAPYTEADQLERSGMRGLGCTVCHDPHRTAAAGLRKACADCHERVARTYRESLMAKARVVCIDCHMPPAGRVAQGNADAYRGDLRSHLFRIEHHELFPERVVDGRSYNPGALGVGYVCLQCHDVFEGRQWALAYASVVHRLRATTNARIMDFQAAFAYVAMAFALLAFGTGAAMRGWVRPFASPATLASLHRHAAWVTFAIFVFEASICLYVHAPLSQPARFENLGWFILHPVNGAVGFLLYGGKIFAVRRLELGWKTAGAVWGLGLFAFWVLQVVTVVLAAFEIVRM